MVTFIDLGLGAGLSIGTRILGGLALVYALIGFIPLLIQEVRSEGAREALHRFVHVVVVLLPGLAFGYLVMGLIWPWSIMEVGNPLHALTYFSHFFEKPWKEMFDGALVSVPDMPWSYLPTLFALQLPEVLLVLSIAGANVANLMFAQAVTRQREMAVRLALGATRTRLRKQFLLESLMIALGGGVLGVSLSMAATHGLSAFRVPAPVPLDLAVRADWHVLLFSFVLSVLCGFSLGVGPAWAASRPQLVNALKGEDALARPGRRWTLRDLLVVGQMAMSVVLLSVTILFLRSLESAAKIDIGFRPQGLLAGKGV